MELKLIGASYKGINNIDMNFKIGITSIIGADYAKAIEMLALLKKSKGSLKLKNKTFKNIKELSKVVGYVFEFPEEQFFNNTVKDELIGNKKADPNILEEVLEKVNLDKSLLDRDPFTLSSGEKRKLAIASILMDNKEVIILNEPTIGLDNKSKEAIIKLLRNLKNDKIVIIGSNDSEFVHKISDYIYVVDKEIILEGKKYDVFKNVTLLKEKGISIPKVIEFSSYVLKSKKVRLGYRDDINDLIKDIYRYVR